MSKVQKTPLVFHPPAADVKVKLANDVLVLQATDVKVKLANDVLALQATEDVQDLKDKMVKAARDPCSYIVDEAFYFQKSPPTPHVIYHCEPHIPAGMKFRNAFNQGPWQTNQGPWQKAVVILEDDEGLLTPAGMQVAENYAKRWLEGQRDLALERLHPSLAGLFADIRTDPDLALRHAEG